MKITVFLNNTAMPYRHQVSWSCWGSVFAYRFESEFRGLCLESFFLHSFTIQYIANARKMTLAMMPMIQNMLIFISLQVLI